MTSASVLQRIGEFRRALQMGQADLSIAAIHLTRREARTLFYEVCNPNFSDVMNPFKASGETNDAMVTGREAEFIHEQMNRCFGFPVFVDLDSK